MSNWFAFVVTLTLCVLWVRVVDMAAYGGWVESRLSRKILHITIGPLFVLCWILFDDSPEARWLAAFVPFAITLKTLLLGLGWIEDEASIRSMTRHGDRREILLGPLYYGAVFVGITLLFWKEKNPNGITALLLMCGGDGLGEVVGRRVVSPRLPWNRDKSVAGSVAVFLGGSILTALILKLYVALQIFPGPFHKYILPIIELAIVGTVVESLPIKDSDNLTLPIVSVLAGYFLFPTMN